MGRNKRKSKNKLKAADLDSIMDEAEEATNRKLSLKHLSKKKKKQHQKYENRNKHLVTLTKEHKWYLVKVYDTTVPTREFLEESFKSMIDCPFTILGYHKSVNSARFYLEDNSSGALAMEALSKRMLGMEGRLMNIAVEPCKKFVLMNVEGLQVVKQVLSNRYSNDILDLTNFHYDPTFLAANLLPVLWDDLIFRQILKLIRENAPQIKILNLCKNSLKMQHIRILVSSLKDCPIERINLECNEIENLRELIKSLSQFELIELKLEGNKCLGDIKDPLLYIRTVRSMFPSLKTLDGKDIDTFLAQRSSESATVSPLTEAINPAVPAVDEDKLLLFMKEYYKCMDEDRSKLMAAFTPTANLSIESAVDGLPSRSFEGIEQVKVALSSIPRTKHDVGTFTFKHVKTGVGVSEVEITGKLQMEGTERIVDFVQKFQIIPCSNSLLGCSITIIQFK